MAQARDLEKVAMAGSGLALLGFLVVHLYGSALVINGAVPFNQFLAALHRTGALLVVAEVVLALLLLVHIVASVLVRLEKKKAPTATDEVLSPPEPTTVFSRTMMATGLIILLFVPIHAWRFRFGKPPELGGLWSLVMQEFADPIAVLWYLVASIALGMHLSHGIGSGVRSLGRFGPRRQRTVQNVGILVAWLIALGFASLPIWAFVRNQSF
jgi:succinate dehydrogenase / fumarate reductase cytochrome b subunit